jgi:hypothetical protein
MEKVVKVYVCFKEECSDPKSNNGLRVTKVKKAIQENTGNNKQ